MVANFARGVSSGELKRTPGVRPAYILACLSIAAVYPSDRAYAGSICTEAGNTQEYACASQFQSTYYNSRVVTNVVGNRVGPDPGPPQGGQLAYAPSGLTDDPAANAIVEQAVTTATSGQAMAWNAWLDGNYVYTDRDHPVFAYDGPMVTTSAGLDRSVGQSSVIGLLINYEHVDFDTTVTNVVTTRGPLESDSFGIGAYGGSALTENIVADAMFLYSWADNDVVDLIAPAGANYNSERIQAAANLTGYWFNEAWRYSPAIGVTWTREELDGYAGGIVPDRALESAVALASLQIGRTHYYDEVRWIEPFIGVSGEWEFHTSGLTSGVPGVELDPFDVRILGGINTQISPSVSANVRADIAGLARNDYLVGSFGGQLAVRF